jgi:hypothetical protein
MRAFAHPALAKTVPHHAAKAGMPNKNGAGLLPRRKHF